jgi:hypothetical protein
LPQLPLATAATSGQHPFALPLLFATAASSIISPVNHHFTFAFAPASSMVVCGHAVE